MNGRKLDHIDEEKDLGILIDDKLNFHCQTAAAVKKANKILGLVKRTFLVLDKTTLPLLFTSLVRPHLEYGNVIWGPFLKGDIKAVERVQRRATKMVSKIAHLPYEERLRQLQLPSLLHRRRRGDMIQMHKIINEDVSVEKNLFVKRQLSITRRHMYKLRKSKATRLPRINVFSNRVIDNWNDLPSKVVTAKTTILFKNEIDEHWANRIYDTPF